MVTEHSGDVLTLRLDLPTSLSRLAEPAATLHLALRASIVAGLAELMTALGIPGQASVEIAAAADEVAAGGRVMRVTVDGRRTRYPDDVLLYAYAYVNERLLDPDATPARISDWLKERCEGSPDEAARNAVVEFLCLSCLEILKRQPSVLFGPAHAVAYAAALQETRRAGADTSGPTVDADWLAPILAQVLDLKISLANRQRVADVLARGRAAAQSADAVVEDLIDALAADVVEIQAPRSYLQELTTRWAQDGPGTFSFLRDGMLLELGLAFPPLRFVAAEGLKANCFAFKVNHVASLPLRGLDPEQWLVNDTADRLRLNNIEAIATVSPATGQPNSIMNARAEGPADLTTWNQVQHLVLCLAEFLRQDGWRLVHRSGVQDQLRKLESVLPALVTIVRTRLSDDAITRVLRALIRDRTSVRNLRTILGRWLDYDALERTGLAGPAGSSVSHDAALASALAFVRVGLGPEIAQKAARDTDTAVVYLLDSEIERLTAHQSVQQLADKGDDILRAVRTELAYLPATAQVPSLLTFTESRATLQLLVASEFPRISVIAHEELPPGINVMPVARILLE